MWNVAHILLLFKMIYSEWCNIKDYVFLSFNFVHGRVCHPSPSVGKLHKNDNTKFVISLLHLLA